MCVYESWGTSCAHELACGKVVSVKPTTSLYRLIDQKLGGRFDDFVAEKRSTLSWDELRDAIHEATGETVTRNTLQKWFAGRLEITTTVRVAS